jgi:hypothetical protein
LFRHTYTQYLNIAPTLPLQAGVIRRDGELVADRYEQVDGLLVQLDQTPRLQIEHLHQLVQSYQGQADDHGQPLAPQQLHPVLVGKLADVLRDNLAGTRSLTSETAVLTPSEAVRRSCWPFCSSR